MSSSPIAIHEIHRWLNPFAKQHVVMTTTLTPGEIAARLQPYLREREDYSPVAGFLLIASAVRRFLARVWSAIRSERRAGFGGPPIQTSADTHEYSEIRCVLHKGGMTLKRSKSNMHQLEVSYLAMTHGTQLDALLVWNKSLTFMVCFYLLTVWFPYAIMSVIWLILHPIPNSYWDLNLAILQAVFILVGLVTIWAIIKLAWNSRNDLHVYQEFLASIIDARETRTAP